MTDVLRFLACLPLILQISASDVEVEPGQDGVLPCQAPSGAAVTVVKWTKDGHPADEYLLLYRNSRSYDNHQPEAYRGRVVLKDPAVTKDGDFSVVLKNVSMEDTGTYRCLVLMSSTETSVEVIPVSHLEVIRLRTAMPSEDPEEPDVGSPGVDDPDVQMVSSGGEAGVKLPVGVGLSVACLVAVVGFLVFRRKKSSHHQLAAEP